MARELTFDEAIALLKKGPERIRPEVLEAQNLNVLLVEGQAKINCGYTSADGPAPATIPGSAYESCPYEHPPHEEGTLCRGNHGWVEELYGGAQIKGLVGNSVQEYNLYVHEGTSVMGARPFLFDAVRQQRDNITRNLSAGVAKGLARAKQEGGA